MNDELRRFLAERAENLAFLQLTRSGDLVVNRVASGEGTDFLVTVARRGALTGRIFGVQVKAREGSVDRAADLRGSTEARAMADAPFPFCVFVFTMADNRGYYRWLKEPVLGARRKPLLRAADPSDWHELNDDAMAKIVECVDAWYDARPQPQAA
ncbi:MAG TPA: DUF4365 domain-containing protein [Longimicrobiaceae bacterium]